MWRGPASQGNVSGPTMTDGHHSPVDEPPPVVSYTFEQNLKKQHFCEACEQLIDRENRLFGEITEAEALMYCEEEVDKLAADRGALEKLVFQTVEQALTLSPEEVDHKAAASTLTLASAVKVICQEDEQDKLWKQSRRNPPPWRPSGWKKLHESALRDLVEKRIDNPSTPPPDQQGQSSLQADVYSMGRQLKEDLLLVVMVAKDCYPSEMDICNVYARLYHQTLSSRLRKITDFGLDDKDCTFILRWVNEFYPQILQKPELASEIDAKALGKLLPDELLEPLEEQYLSKQQSELTTYIGRVLEEEKQKWNEGEEPNREDGCYSSPVAYDIIQLINGMVTSAETIVGNLQKAQTITCQLKGLMQRFKLFQEDVIRQNRPNSKALIKANLGSIEQFRDVLVRKKHLFPEDVQKNCLSVLTDMKQSAHTYLLSPVHKVLKPHYQKLGTSDWLNKNMFEKLLIGMEKELQELQGSNQTCHQELIGQLHQEVTKEYVRRLLRGDVKLRDKDRQQKAYMTVKDNAESLHKLFNKMGSKEEWLKEILTKIAEVLKLQDIPAIQMQIVSLGSAYPDLSERHVSALLKLKTNVSKADRKTVKATLSDTLRETIVTADTRPFFANVEVR